MPVPAVSIAPTADAILPAAPSWLTASSTNSLTSAAPAREPGGVLQDAPVDEDRWAAANAVVATAPERPIPSTTAQAAPRRADRRQCPDARYPSVLRSRGVEGTVQLRVQVARDGRTAAVELLQGSGYRLFDEAAVAQARGCRFEPARQGDQPIDSWVEFAVRFALQDGA